MKLSVVIPIYNEEQNITLALMENTQRADLDPIEEAKGYRMLINRFKLKQQDVAAKVGKQRATIANSLRLLGLPNEVQQGLAQGLIGAGHAKVLLGLASKEKQREIYYHIVEKGLSVRVVEALVKQIKEQGESEEAEPPKKAKKSGVESHIKTLEDSLVSVLGTKVEIKHSGDKGRIEISYYSLDDFDRLMEILK